MDDYLTHYGVSGMRWGVRKSRSNSSDHNRYSEIKKKKLRDMTDEEVRIITRRSQLLKKLRSATLATSKRPEKMSNEEINGVIRRDKIRREAIKLSLKDPKRALKLILSVGKLSDPDVKKLFDRIMLEKNLSSFLEEDLKSARKLVDELIYKPED